MSGTCLLWRGPRLSFIIIHHFHQHYHHHHQHHHHHHHHHHLFSGGAHEIHELLEVDGAVPIDVALLEDDLRLLLDSCDSLHDSLATAYLLGEAELVVGHGADELPLVDGSVPVLVRGVNVLPRIQKKNSYFRSISLYNIPPCLVVGLERLPHVLHAAVSVPEHHHHHHHHHRRRRRR